MLLTGWSTNSLRVLGHLSCYFQVTFKLFKWLEGTSRLGKCPIHHWTLTASPRRSRIKNLQSQVHRDTTRDFPPPHFLLFHLVSVTAMYQVLCQLLRGKKSTRYRPLSGIGSILKWLLFYLHFESILQFHIFRETWVETDISEYVWNLANICFKHLNKFLSVKNCVWLWITEEPEITVLNKKRVFLLLK